MADLSLILDADWREAKRRAAVIRPLTELERRPRHLILAAASVNYASSWVSVGRRFIGTWTQPAASGRTPKSCSVGKERVQFRLPRGHICQPDFARSGSLQRTLTIRCSRLWKLTSSTFITHDKGRWTNPRSGSRVSRRRRAHDNKCAGRRAVLDHPSVASYNVPGSREKVIGRISQQGGS